MKDEDTQLPKPPENHGTPEDPQASELPQPPQAFIDALKDSQAEDVAIPENLDLNLKSAFSTHFKGEAFSTADEEDSSDVIGHIDSKITYRVSSQTGSRSKRNKHRWIMAGAGIAAMLIVGIGAAAIILPMLNPEYNMANMAYQSDMLEAPSMPSQKHLSESGGFMATAPNVLTVFQLEKLIQQGQPLGSEWDLNNDGSVTQNDLDAMMKQIVTLPVKNSDSGPYRASDLSHVIAGPPSTLPAPTKGLSFVAYEVWIDSGDASLAAWQIDLTFANGTGLIVGIEGGAADSVFAEPAHYDPKAMEGDRVILASYSLAPKAQLPTGNIRVATIMVAIPEAEKDDYKKALIVAGNENAQVIPTQLQLRRTP